MEHFFIDAISIFLLHQIPLSSQQVMQRHGGFLPEAFTTDFRVHWGQSPLRPEFIESTYFLYKATGDEHYLDVGKAVLNSIEVLAKVPCGYAAIKDVRTGRHEDRMDSFVLAELFKYLFLRNFLSDYPQSRLKMTEKSMGTKRPE